MTQTAHGLLVAGALILSGLSTGAPEAKARSTGSEQCWVTPNPVGVGMPYTVSGSGFEPGQPLDILVDEERIRTTVVDTFGNLARPEWAQFDSGGTKNVTVHSMMDRRKRSVLAKCSFEVAP